jgi:hypothetical protein
VQGGGWGVSAYRRVRGGPPDRIPVGPVGHVGPLGPIGSETTGTYKTYLTYTTHLTYGTYPRPVSSPTSLSPRRHASRTATLPCLLQFQLCPILIAIPSAPRSRWVPHKAVV